MKVQSVKHLTANGFINLFPTVQETNHFMAFTIKQEFVTLLHLRFFREFQNLSEETWSRAAENLIMLHGISKQQK